MYFVSQAIVGKRGTPPCSQDAVCSAITALGGLLFFTIAGKHMVSFRSVSTFKLTGLGLVSGFPHLATRGLS